MNPITNDLHIDSRIANDVDRARANFIALHPAALIAAALAEQSKEIAQLILIGGKAIINFINKFSWRAIKKTHSYNNAVRELEEMDDWALQDIGVLRSMISCAVRGQMADKKYGV